MRVRIVCCGGELEWWAVRPLARDSKGRESVSAGSDGNMYIPSAYNTVKLPARGSSPLAAGDLSGGPAAAPRAAGQPFLALRDAAARFLAIFASQLGSGSIGGSGHAA